MQDYRVIVCRYTSIVNGAIQIPNNLLELCVYIFVETFNYFIRHFLNIYYYYYYFPLGPYFPSKRGISHEVEPRLADRQSRTILVCCASVILLIRMVNSINIAISIKWIHLMKLLELKLFTISMFIFPSKCCFSLCFCYP